MDRKEISKQAMRETKYVDVFKREYFRKWFTLEEIISYVDGRYGKVDSPIMVLNHLLHTRTKLKLLKKKGEKIYGHFL